VYRIASRLIRSYVLRRAKGHCEACTRPLRFAVLTVHRILKRTIRSNWLTTDRITPRRLSDFAQTVTAGRISVRMQNPSMRRWYENCPNWSVPQRTPRLRFCDWLHVRSVRRMRLSQCSRPSASLPDSLLRKRRSARMHLSSGCISLSSHFFQRASARSISSVSASISGWYGHSSLGLSSTPCLTNAFSTTRTGTR